MAQTSDEHNLDSEFIRTISHWIELRSASVHALVFIRCRQISSHY